MTIHKTPEEFIKISQDAGDYNSPDVNRALEDVYSRLWNKDFKSVELVKISLDREILPNSLTCTYFNFLFKASGVKNMSKDII